MVRRRFLGLAVLACAAVAGCGPHWIVLSQASPNVLLGARQFAVMPIDFSGLHVGEKDEAGYLAEKDEGQRVAWARDKLAVNELRRRPCGREAAKRGIQSACSPRGRGRRRSSCGRTSPGWSRGF